MEKELPYKLLEQSKVGPSMPIPPNRTNLPLTFLDFPFVGPVHVRRQFFYHFPYPTQHFITTNLPSLKHSLSIALHHFFPLTGNLLSPPPPHKPFINSTTNPSVAFTVIESTSSGHDFNHYSSNHPKNLKDCDFLVPKLEWSVVDDNGVDSTFVFPILALRVTIFPNSGICIGMTYCHVMDASSCSHFMKTWASICRSNGGDMSFLEKSTPLYDREVIKDPRDLEAIFLRDYFMERSTWKERLVSKVCNNNNNDDEQLYKATILFSRKDVEELRKWAMKNLWEGNNEESNNAPKYLSTFVVTCGFVWTRLVKARHRDNNIDEEEKDEYFCFAADCRNLMEYPVGKNYFGNCLTRCNAMLKRKELRGEGGILKAMKVIDEAIQDMKKEPLKDAEKWKENFHEIFILGSAVLVTGSPKFGFYETDFGFGRPKKVEMAHSLKCMSLTESGYEEGGLEVGLVFRRDEYEDL